MNGRGDEFGISSETQQRVLEKAKQLNYKPNPIARGLRTGRSNLIGLIVADVSNTFYATIARDIETEARKAGYQLVVCSTEEKAENEKQLINMMVSELNVNGIIVATTQRNTEFLKGIKADGPPLVLIDRKIEGLDADYIGVDNYKGAFTATEHLIRLGYKRIGLFTISPGFISSIADRKEGFLDAMKKHKMKVSPGQVCEISFDDVKTNVHRELRKLISPPNAIDALFTLNNTIAAYSLEFLSENGLRIPQDMALVSFDDVEYFHFVTPSITAVAQPVHDIGKRSFELLEEQMKDRKGVRKGRKIELPVELVVRRSCGEFLRKASK
jgi:LacI family transcriptional regulator